MLFTRGLIKLNNIPQTLSSFQTQNFKLKHRMTENFFQFQPVRFINRVVNPTHKNACK